MDVSEAIRTAKQYVQTVFQDDGIADVGLEEVAYDERSDTWSITVGFARDRGNHANPLSSIFEMAAANRIYKVVQVSNASGAPISVKNRPLE